MRDKFQLPQELLQYNLSLWSIKQHLKPRKKLQGFWLDVFHIWVKHNYHNAKSHAPTGDLLNLLIAHNTVLRRVSAKGHINGGKLLAQYDIPTLKDLLNKNKICKVPT